MITMCVYNSYNHIDYVKSFHTIEGAWQYFMTCGCNVYVWCDEVTNGTFFDADVDPACYAAFVQACGG